MLVYDLKNIVGLNDFINMIQLPPLIDNEIDIRFMGNINNMLLNYFVNKYYCCYLKYNSYNKLSTELTQRFLPFTNRIMQDKVAINLITDFINDDTKRENVVEIASNNNSENNSTTLNYNAVNTFNITDPLNTVVDEINNQDGGKVTANNIINATSIQKTKTSYFDLFNILLQYNKEYSSLLNACLESCSDLISGNFKGVEKLHGNIFKFDNSLTGVQIIVCDYFIKYYSSYYLLPFGRIKNYAGSCVKKFKGSAIKFNSTEKIFSNGLFGININDETETNLNIIFEKYKAFKTNFEFDNDFNRLIYYICDWYEWDINSFFEKLESCYKLTGLYN